MATETAEPRGVSVTARPPQVGVEQQGPPLPCPRCTSTNTKFCYYNNYNFSQPRHFCKSCRRYWTQGGTLRDIPVGGGSRRTAKRSRTTSSAPPSVSCSVSATATTTATHQGHHLYASLPISGVAGSGFTSLLALGGFGVGLDDVGYAGLGPRGVWAFPQHNGGGMCVSGGGKPENGGGGDTWQMENVGLVGVGGGVDCYTMEIPPLPELAISTGGGSES